MSIRLEFDFREMKVFLKKMQRAASQDLKKQIVLFLEDMGLKFLDIVQDEIIRSKVIDTKLLISGFQKGSTDNVWKMNEGDLTLEVGTDMLLAGYINDGHRSDKKGKEQCFVPGIWEGDRFIYQPEAKTGIVFNQRWV